MMSLVTDQGLTLPARRRSFSCCKLSWAIKIDANREDYRLHKAVGKSRRFQLQHLLASHPEWDPTLQDDYGRTPLHYAVICPNHTVAHKMVTILLDCKQMKISKSKNCEQCDTQKLAKFVNIQDCNGESAVYLAASKFRHEIVYMLLTKCSPDLSLKSINGKSARKLVFTNTPEAMNKILNTRITYPVIQEVSGSLLFHDGNRTTINLDLRDIVDLPHPVSLSSDQAFVPTIETQAFASAFDRGLGENKDKTILTHPLIRTFLALKWDKLRPYTYSAMVLKMILLLLYNYFTYNLYVHSCPYQHGITDQQTKFPKPKRSWDLNNYYVQHNDIDEHETTLRCGNGTSTFVAILLVISSMLMGMKEMYKLIRFKSFTMGGTFIANFLFIPAVFSTVIPIFLEYSDIDDWYYQAAALGVLISWSLFLMEMRNIPRWGIGKYVEIFGKVIKRFVKLLLIFVVLLNAFMLSFGMLMPKVPKFVFPFGILEGLVMMTGEVNFDEVFYAKNNIPNAFGRMTQVIYTAFVVIVSIMLVNLLIGFTVSDVTQLRQDALVNQLAKKLQHIHFLETLLFDLARACKCFAHHYRKIQLIPLKQQKNRDPILTVFLDKIPTKLQQNLRKLAFKNADQFDDLKIPVTEGVTWVEAKNGVVPEGAVLCQYLDGNEHLYVTRVTHGKNIIPGKLRKSLRVTYYPWNGRELKTNVYEVMTVADPTSVSWLEFNSKDDIPRSAIPAGITEEGELLFVGQGNIENSAHGIGRVDYSDRVLSIPYGGAEVYCEQYQILVKH